jgi:hypothetical protein
MFYFSLKPFAYVADHSSVPHMAVNFQVSRTLAERVCGSRLVPLLLGTLFLIATAAEFSGGGPPAARAASRDGVSGRGTSILLMRLLP